jgi:hypothetical protein
MCRRLACRLPRRRHDSQGHSQRPLVGQVFRVHRLANVTEYDSAAEIGISTIAD